MGSRDRDRCGGSCRGMYEGCSECRPLWPINVGKKCPVAADAEVSNLEQLQRVGVEQLYSTLDSLGTYTR